nr:Csa1 family protein [Staphylococcus pettenkoferi]
MKKFLNLTIILISLSILVLINGCDKSTSYEHDIQIKNNIHDSLKIYPIKNLEDLYDIEGAKSEDFKKGDKGKW